MNQPDTDLISDEHPAIAAESALEGSLTREFVRPKNSLTWKGLELWPLCNGGEILFQQVLDPTDANLTLVLIWIFIYVKRDIPVFSFDGASGKQKKVGMRPARDAAEAFEEYMVPLCWDKIGFRGAFLRWLDSLGPLTLDDKQAALRMFDESHGWVAKSAVVPVPEVGKKKGPASRRTRSRSSSNSSRKKKASRRRNATSSGTSRRSS